MMLLMGAMAFGAITLGRATRHHVWPRMFEANPLLVTDLDAARVDALFDLLKPEDVPVLVREDGDRLLVEGSTHRVGAVRDLVNILRRHVHRGQGDLPRETAIRKTYELSRKHAAALARALSYSHASIRVYRDENELSVTASPVDQQAISQLVRSVLRGREVRASRRD
ncbi:MAG TPA: hypothetical protein VNT79_15715 [Phycisphaerae bacterium]|nr:hypothetical protein [Phycisphaerae bacterium]